MSKARIFTIALAVVIAIGLCGWLLLSRPKNSVVVTTSTPTPPVQQQPMPQGEKERLQVALNNADKQQQWAVLWQETAEAYIGAQAHVVPPGADVVFEDTFVSQGNYAQVEAVAKGIEKKPRLLIHLIRSNTDQPWKIFHLEVK